MKTITFIVVLFVASISNVFAQNDTATSKKVLFSGFYENGEYKFTTDYAQAEVKTYTYNEETDQYNYLDTYFPKPGEVTKIHNYSLDTKDLYVRMITSDNRGFDKTNNIYWAKTKTSETTKK